MRNDFIPDQTVKSTGSSRIRPRLLIKRYINKKTLSINNQKEESTNCFHFIGAFQCIVYTIISRQK